MLQQTQVATALPFYAAFLRRFPTVSALAAARLPQVLAAWSGLGYYRRARHLHAAARVVARQHGGRVPSDPETLARLPGVGRYTLGAVLSIAFDQPRAVLDGNVARVLARWFAWPVSVRNAADARRLWALAERLIPMRGAGEWNQALMELGAMVCTPRQPMCAACPVRAWCRAHALGRPEAFPRVAPRRPTERLRRAVVLLERRGRVLMTRREGALLEGLWEPPGVDLSTRATARRALSDAVRALGLCARLEPAGRVVRHTITHRSIAVEVWRGAPSGTPRGAARFVDPHRPAVPLTALAARLARDRRAQATLSRRPTPRRRAGSAG